MTIKDTRTPKPNTKYVFCTRSKNQCQKAIEVCAVCADRGDCDEYKEAVENG